MREDGSFMKKIMIVGPAGSGKSTLALQLHKHLGLPVFHLDSFFWEKGWVMRSDDDFQADINKILEKQAWITDGNYSRFSTQRMKDADTLIFIDFGKYFSVWRIINRYLKEKGRERISGAKGCPEKIDWEFIKWVWNWPKKYRQYWLNIPQEYPNLNFIHLTSTKEIKVFLEKL